MATLPQPAPPPGATNQQGAAPMQGDPGSGNAATQQVIRLVTLARQIAQDNPEVVGEVQKINDLAQKINMKLMQKAKPAEPAAPPV